MSQVRHPEVRIRRAPQDDEDWLSLLALNAYIRPLHG